MMRRYLILLVSLVLTAVATLRIAAAGKLDLYIHPSTAPFTVASAFVLLGLLGLALVRRLDHIHATRFQVGMVTVVAVIVAFSANVAPGINLVQQRQTDAVPLGGRNAPNLSQRTQQFTILEWLAAWEGDPTGTRFEGAPAKVTGFLTRDGDRVLLNRLLLTCCVIDAQPAQLQLSVSGDLPNNGVWVEVSGSMRDADGRPLLVVTSLREIPEPASPYLY